MIGEAIVPPATERSLLLRRVSVTEKDHLFRQVEQLGFAFARIRELILGGELALARTGLRQLAGQTGVDLEVLGVLAPESLLQVMMGSGEGNLEKLIPAVEVLFLKGELEESVGQVGRSSQSYAKAALLARQVRAGLGEGADPALKARLEEVFRMIDERTP